MASTGWPHEEQVSPAVALAPVFAPAGGGAYTRVAGAAPPVGVVAGPTAMADTDRGLPQSMQNRDPGSFCRPQWAHVITFRVASDVQKAVVEQRQYRGRSGVGSTELN